jgi:hypothetical protein
LYSRVEPPSQRTRAYQRAEISQPEAVAVLNPIKLLTRTRSTCPESVLPQTRRSQRIRNLAIAGVVALGAIYSLNVIGQYTSKLISGLIAGDPTHPLSFLSMPSPTVDDFSWVIEGDQSYIVGVRFQCKLKTFNPLKPGNLSNQRLHQLLPASSYYRLLPVN